MNPIQCLSRYAWQMIKGKRRFIQLLKISTFDRKFCYVNIKAFGGLKVMHLVRISSLNNVIPCILFVWIKTLSHIFFLLRNSTPFSLFLLSNTVRTNNFVEFTDFFVLSLVGIHSISWERSVFYVSSYLAFYWLAKKCSKIVEL